MGFDVVHTESSLGWGGQEIRILSESRGMIERGHRVRLLCPREARIYHEASRFNVPVEALPIGRKNLRGLSAMLRWMRRHRESALPYVFNTHSSTDSWLVALSGALLGNHVPIVRTRHISAPVPGNWPTRWLYTSAAEKVVTTGEALRKQLIADVGLPSHRVISVPTGIDTRLYVPGARTECRGKLGLPSDMILVGIVATLRSWKGHRYLVEAIAGMPSNIGLVIVGDGPQKEAIEALVLARNLSQRAWMPGNQVDVLPWLQALDIFALPSYANEGVPQALIQAMLVGLPCVTTGAGSIGEIAIPDRTALVVPAESVQPLSDAILRLSNDEQLCASLGAAARGHCLQNYSLTKMLDSMESVFAACVTQESNDARN